VTCIRHAFAKANFLNPVLVLPNGDEAIAYFQGGGKYANRDEYPLPSLLLLDLKMPRRDGFEVLQWIRKQPALTGLRVVVLTASDHISENGKSGEGNVCLSRLAGAALGRHWLSTPTFSAFPYKPGGTHLCGVIRSH